MPKAWVISVEIFENDVKLRTDDYLVGISDKSAALAAVVEKTGHRTVTVRRELTDDQIRLLGVSPGTVFKTISIKEPSTKH
jgi:hypothetical protein